ncbi:MULTISPECIES: hypothetical protein [unclassified Bradyrhizobium]|uniref:hypothetical protein n=1 Tax=unclassified Bradyrhizobium TaxID=2631580 RepID=UPI0033964EB8
MVEHHGQSRASAVVRVGVADLGRLGDVRSATRSAQFTALHIGVALIACIVQWLGHGIFGNAEFDLIFALAIGLGAAFNRVGDSWLAMRIGANRCRDAMVAALLLRLFLSDRQETAMLLSSPEFWAIALR